MNFTRRSSSNNLVRQVLKEIIADPLPPPSSSRKSVELEQIKMNEAVTYLQRKIERQQSEIKILSQQLGKEIECKEHLMMVVTEEKEKNSKMNGHLSNANKLNGEMKKKLGKMETAECKQGKLREEYELKLAKGKDMLRKKQEQLLRASARIQELQAAAANITHIQRQLKQLREKMKVMSQRQSEMAKKIQSLGCELQEERERSKAKDETILFSEEHLRRLRSEYQEFQYEQYKEQEEWRTIQAEMKNLLEKQNQQIKALNQQLATKRQQTDHDNSREDSSVHSFLHHQRPEFQLSIFKSQLKRALINHIHSPNLRHSLQSDLLVILQAIETSFNGILDQLLIQIQ